MAEIVRFALRLPPELYEALRSLAAQDRRSINGEIVFILDQHVADERKRAGRLHEDEGGSGKMQAAA